MAINTRTEYALRALIEMIDKGEPISAREICQRQALPKKYVEHLLSGLKAADLVNSSSGSHGGYTLAHKPEQISLIDIMNAVEDNSLDVSCSSERDSFCLGPGCGLSDVFGKLSHKMNALLATFTLKDFYDSYKKKHKKEKK